MLPQMSPQLLVVEDDDGIAAPLQRTLEREGYTVERVATGQAGLERVARGGIDLVVRYDDALAAELGLNENVLKLWKYQDGQWTRIFDGFERHPDLNILIGHTNGGIEYFAVSAPDTGNVIVRVNRQTSGVWARSAPAASGRAASTARARAA